MGIVCLQVCNVRGRSVMSHVGNVDWHLIMYDPGIALMLYCWLQVTIN